MNAYVKFALILFGLAYLISPVDIIPDILVPYLGWLDDGLVLWTVYYLIRYGQMPWFLFKKRGVPGKSPGPAGQGGKRFTGTPNGSGPKQNRSRASGTSTSETNSRQQDRAEQPKSPHDILGLGPDASWEQIHAAYKENIKKYHPDKVQHLGKEFAHLANEKFLEIQTAYETLKKRAGK